MNSSKQVLKEILYSTTAANAGHQALLYSRVTGGPAATHGVVRYDCELFCMECALNKIHLLKSLGL